MIFGGWLFRARGSRPAHLEQSSARAEHLLLGHVGNVLETLLQIRLADILVPCLLVGHLHNPKEGTILDRRLHADWRGCYSVHRRRPPRRTYRSVPAALCTASRCHPRK